MNLLPLIVLTLTVYHATEKECDGTPLKTAGGYEIESSSNAFQHRYIALSRELLKEYPYGTKVTISGSSVEEYNGVFIVADTMNKRYSGMCDILIDEGMPLTKEKVNLERYEK